MATTKFYLDSRRIKSGDPGILKISITHRRKVSYINLDIKLHAEQEWDSQKEKVINRRDALMFNTYIQGVKNTIDRFIVSKMVAGELKFLSVKELRDLCEAEIFPEKKAKLQKADSFIARFDKYASLASPGSRRIYDHTRGRLAAFMETEAELNSLTFEDITVDWLKRFDSFMAQTSPSRNARNIHFRNIRTVFNAAIDDGITDSYPFRRFKLKREETAKRDLSVGELRTLLYYDCEKCAEKYRDYFMLMFLLIGINNVDLCHLTDIRKGRIEYHRAKTRHFFSIKVEPEAAMIIERYAGKKWLVDILDRWDSDVFFRQKMNLNLGRIGPVTRSGLGGKKTFSPLFPGLTTYYARHSWASIASSLEIPIDTISEGLGHESGNQITRIYIHNDYHKIDVANRKVIDWVYYGKINGEEIVKPGTPAFFGLDPKVADTLGLIKV